MGRFNLAVLLRQQTKNIRKRKYRDPQDVCGEDDEEVTEEGKEDG